MDGESRWQTIGMVEGLHVLLVVHTTPESDDEDDEEEQSIRIISARKATPQERRIYAHGG